MDYTFRVYFPSPGINKKISGQETGGTRRLFLTVAIFRSWRGSKGFAAPGLPGRCKHTR